MSTSWEPLPSTYLPGVNYVGGPAYLIVAVQPTAASRNSLHRCRRGGGHRTASWHPTIDTSVQQYAIEQRILQMREEDELMTEEARGRAATEARRAFRRAQQQVQCNLVQHKHQLEPSERKSSRVRDVISLLEEYGGIA